MIFLHSYVVPKKCKWFTNPQTILSHNILTRLILKTLGSFRSSRGLYWNYFKNVLIRHSSFKKLLFNVCVGNTDLGTPLLPTHRKWLYPEVPCRDLFQVEQQTECSPIGCCPAGSAISSLSSVFILSSSAAAITAARKKQVPGLVHA